MTQVRTGDQGLVKELNKGIVLNLLLRQSPISRAAMAKMSGLNKATVSALVDELAAEGMVVELGPGESSGGRRPNLLMLNEQAGVVAGVDLGVGYLLVVLMDMRAAVRWERRVTWDCAVGPEVCLEQVAALVEEGMAALPLGPRGLLGVGVGVPGLVDHRQGRLLFAPNLPWRDVDIAPLLSRRLGVPVLVDNEANAGAVGELWAGCARGVSNLVFLSVGVGLGAGIVLGREVYRGAGGVAGELGHSTIDVAGPVCRCGNRGCWELYASEAALLAEVARRGGGAGASVGAVADAARAGDAAAAGALAAVGEYLGVGIANIINTFNPALVVIGSSIAEGGEFILNPARRAVAERALAHPRAGAQVALSALGAEACAIGAGALVLQEQFRLPTLFG
ncbi:MAG: glucokinase [Symbiobacteriaceae bacterium]|jgi:predicted NBD/HSP70 family sugar kinase|nr:glucokinase [Symbiobacteriaceae bacterium]